MALTPEQIEEVKQQLREQVENLPEERKQQALSQINSLSPHAVEAMIKQQQSKNSSDIGQKDKTIFRMIIDKDIPSVGLSENKDAIAVLDINPISKGHIIIIPKKPLNDAKKIPTSAFTLAKKLGGRVVEKLKAKSNEIQTENKFGEVIINLIPCYDSQLNINSQRSKSSMEELEKIGFLLRDKIKLQKIKIAKKKSSGNQPLILKRRIP